MNKFKKNCYHCFYIRPKKDNFCAILKCKITDTLNLYCDHFNPDIVILRREEDMDENSDEGSERLSLANV